MNKKEVEKEIKKLIEIKYEKIEHLYKRIHDLQKDINGMKHFLKYGNYSK